MAISRREAGHLVECPKCGNEITVPFQDFPTPTADPRPKVEPSIEEDGVEPNAEIFEEVTQPPEGNAQNEPNVLTGGESEEGEATDERFADADEAPFVPAEIGNDDDSEGPLTFKRKPMIADDMDLTPMVDVTFQLLIFFMVSASFSLQKSIEVPTPDPDQKGATQQVKTLEDLQGTSILVKIDASNGIWIDDEPLSDVSRLAETLRDKMRREQKTELLVSASSQSLHRTVIAVIDAANEIGVQKIRMSSQKKAD
ncbi:ExbD/TolR family protein [Schlesneria paludicola]|uniref:ExbD/TolR family protein n=1 Tax=Schlesneria paludicola TaxID=360056 RepID=UPI000492B2FB|nr:biopolymer transporter ExbD [Schlesneria paludicola]